jgi:hypothetical protein
MTIRLNGNTSGYTEIDAKAVAGSNTLQLPASNGNAFQIMRNGATAGSLEFSDKIVSGTAVASTSGTAIDFTGIPSWVKRVTVMFIGVSTNGTSVPLIQLGAGSNQATGYLGAGLSSATAGAPAIVNYTTGFGIAADGRAADVRHGLFTIALAGSNTWVCSGYFAQSDTTRIQSTGGSVTLSGTLDRVRITTVNGTDTFDAGSINILYE